MKIQLALDRISKNECFSIINETYDYIDWIEIGTSVIKEYGMDIVRDIRKEFPHKKIVADMKICDAGGYEAEQAFKAGADITTVMGFSSNLTITDTLNVAQKYNKEMMIDLLEINNRKRVEEIVNLGVNLLSLHVGKDKQTEYGFQTDLFELVEGLPVDISVAGGIRLQNIESIKTFKPKVIIVGSAITNSESPGEQAKLFKQALI